MRKHLVPDILVRDETKIALNRLVRTLYRQCQLFADSNHGICLYSLSTRCHMRPERRFDLLMAYPACRLA